MAEIIKVHGSALSTATQRVLACLYEKELAFEFIPVNMAVGEHKKEPFLALNVSVKFPCLISTEWRHFPNLHSESNTSWCGYFSHLVKSQLLNKEILSSSVYFLYLLLLNYLVNMCLDAYWSVFIWQIDRFGAQNQGQSLNTLPMGMQTRGLRLLSQASRWQHYQCGWRLRLTNLTQ